MNHEFPLVKKSKLISSAMMAFTISMALSGCGEKSNEQKASQSLVRVNGKEITVHQLNEELSRANVPQAQKDTATKQILNALIDRQLLEQAALQAKVDRDPNVMQAIDRAKSQIIAQYYLQSKAANVGKVDKSEVEDFYKKNPALFAERKLVDMEQLLIDSKHINDEFKSVLGNFKSLQEVSAWLDSKNVQYDRGEVSRSVAELPSQISERLKDARKGQLFVIGMGPRTMLVQMDNVKDSPVNLDEAAPQIDQLLANKKRKEVSDSELQRLRTAAKIEYIDKNLESTSSIPAKEVVSNEQVEKKTDVRDEIVKGAAGLK